MQAGPTGEFEPSEFPIFMLFFLHDYTKQSILYAIIRRHNCRLCFDQFPSTVAAQLLRTTEERKRRCPFVGRLHSTNLIDPHIPLHGPGSRRAIPHGGHADNRPPEPSKGIPDAKGLQVKHGFNA